MSERYEDIVIGGVVRGRRLVVDAPLVITPDAPHSVTRAQAIAALIITGKRDAVQAVIDAIPDPLERALAQNDWDNRLTFERDNPRLQAIAAALDIDLDAMFVLAAQQ